MTTPSFTPKGGLSAARSRYQGFSLVTVMIILVVVSLLGVAASQMVLLGERSARYDRDWQIAFQAAELSHGRRFRSIQFSVAGEKGRHGSI